ncbi:MAG: Cys-tRNA(Pro) deacylase [Jiangellales bacterium]
MAKKSGRAGSGATPAVRALVAAGVTFTEHPYEHDPSHPSFGLEAADALGLEPASVFKTLLAHVDAALVVTVLPVTCQLDLKALAAAAGGKRAALAKPADAERVTGYVVGGISPLGQRKALPTVVDSSAETLETMYVSGGRRGFDLGLAPTDLIALTRASVAAVTAPAR